MCGRVDRPKFTELKLDAKGMLLLPKAIAAARKGDDALLRFIVGICEDEGLRAISVAAGRACAVFAAKVRWGASRPIATPIAPISKPPSKIVHTLGALDVGQAAVVCEGLPLAVEAAEGTDAMLARIPGLRESLARHCRGKPRGVLVEGAQAYPGCRRPTCRWWASRRVRGAANAFLAGIALEAGACLILDKAAVAAEADRLGLFCYRHEAVKPAATHASTDAQSKKLNLMLVLRRAVPAMRWARN